MKTVLERASAYLARMPVSVSGQRGNAAAFTAATALVRGFDLSEQEALPLLCRWNEDCLPPWRENELRRKLHHAATTATQRPGYLLDSPPSASSSRKDSGSTERAPAAPAPTEDRAWLRELWPEFHPLSREDIRTVARQRGILPDAVDLAHRHGFLRVAQVQEQRCLILREGRFAQARRLDGLPLRSADGELIKSRNLTGSQGAFIGQGWLGETTHVLLVEGAIGLIEGLAAMLQVNTGHAWSILAATSASSRFARDPELLERLHGRELHIIPDNDEAGLNASASWLADLLAAGVCAHVHFLRKPCKDLGDVLHLPEAERLSTLHRPFLPLPPPLP